MTSILLTELADFVEVELGVAAAARLTVAAERESHRDVRGLLAIASPGCDTEALLCAFGRRLFARFAALYPAFFAGTRCWRELLLEVAPQVHGEIRVLQPEAELPSLSCRPLGTRGVEVEYRSPRDLGALAEGLLLGCLEYFGATGSVSRESLSAAEGHSCRFLVRAA